MLNSSSIKSSFLIVTAFAAGALISIATTVALAHGGDTSKLHSCVDDTTGAVRMVGENDTCPSGETNVDWDQNSNYGMPFMCNQCALTQFDDRMAGYNFEYAQIFKGNFDDGDFTGVNLSHASIQSSQGFNTVFEDANFSYASLVGNPGGFIDTDFTDANMSHAQLGGPFPGSNFTGADLSYVSTTANLSGANFSNTDFSNATISNDLTATNLSSTDFTNATLEEANLTGATNATTATFTGVTWTNVTCPDGTNSGDHSDTCIGHLTP